MDKPLAVEYVDRRKWFTYEVFEKLKYGKEETIQDCKEDSRRDQQSGDSHSHFDEEEKEEESESDNDHSISSIENSEVESKYDDHRACLNSLRDEIKELRNDIKICMEKIIVPLNAIANYIIKRQEPENEVLNVNNNVKPIIENQEIPQSEVVIHQIENDETMREKYPYEVFIEDKLPHLNPKLQVEYSNALNIAGNIEPLAFFLYKNPALNLKTKKSFASTWKEYYLEYRYFSLQMLKSLFIEKDYKQLESKETLIKKWKQWKRICTISFGVSKESFPVIEFASEKKTHKKVDYDSINEIIANAWKILTSKGNISDALLIHIMYALGLKTGEVRYLRFEDVHNKDRAIIQVYNPQKNKEKEVIISQELYDEIKQYENELINEKKYFKSIRSTADEVSISGHFMFGDWKESISRKFKSKFKGVLSEFNLRLKDIRRASIKHKGYKPLFVHSSDNSDNKESKINKRQSVNPREELKSESKARKSKNK